MFTKRFCQLGGLVYSLPNSLPSKCLDLLLLYQPRLPRRCFCVVSPTGASKPPDQPISLEKNSDIPRPVSSEFSESYNNNYQPLQTNHSQSQISEQKCFYRNIIDSFPDGIQMAFAYGSGAFQQDNSKDKSKNMLDFIFVVDNPYIWHRENLKAHPNHYSFLKRFGPLTISRIQERYGAGVYFNTLVPMGDRIIKYGVVSTNRVQADLLDWESLYISGRLHKPVKLIVVPKNEEILTALTVNLRSAVHAALLLLPDSFSERELYTTIAGLSYTGDFRMAVAEDSNKVSNIVTPNFKLFQQMYRPFLLEDEHVTYWPEEGVLEQALTFHSRFHHLKCLPSNVLLGLLTRKYKVGVFPDLEEIIRRMSLDSECDHHVAQSIKHIVHKSSLSQTAKGFFTAGLHKSLRYSSQKVWKKLNTKR